MPQDRPQLGRFGEAVAALFLERRGVRVVARNVASAVGEIDLIAIHDEEVVAVEVRSARREDPGADLMSSEKARQVRRVAASLDPPIFRIDLVTVLMGEAGVRVRWNRRV